MDIRSPLKRFLNRIGYELHKFNHLNSPLARRMMLMRQFGVDLIFDVGAHDGRYASQMIDYGYRGRIVSFEPLSFAFERLSKSAERVPQWTTVPFALGNQDGTATIHIADDPECSSLRELAPNITELAPRATFVGTEEIRIRKLDDVFDDYYRNEEAPLLKMDVQGFERSVLEGAAASLSRFVGVQLEMSLVPYYEGECAMDDTIAYLRERGFTLMSIEPASAHAVSGQLLQVDGVFFRERR